MVLRFAGAWYGDWQTMIVNPRKSGGKCDEMPCFNHGRCFDDEVNYEAGYYCDCEYSYFLSTWYHGSRCQYRVPCTRGPCGRFSNPVRATHCENSLDYESYVCTCTDEYTGDDCRDKI